MSALHMLAWARAPAGHEGSGIAHHLRSIEGWRDIFLCRLWWQQRRFLALQLWVHLSCIAKGLHRLGIPTLHTPGMAQTYP